MNPPAALIVSVAEELFADDDPSCIKACRHVCQRLEERLIVAGFQVPDWVRGGCDESWGVFLECQDGSTTFAFAIGFFPHNDVRPQNLIFIKHYLKDSGRPVPEDHRLQAIFKDFATSFITSRLFDADEFRAAYG